MNKNLQRLYPRCAQLGLVVKSTPSFDYVERKHLASVLRKKRIVRKYAKFFGIQTQYLDGPFAHDVEPVLERILSGKLTGTQLYYD